ncbi:MAG: hypothetical protein JKY71_11865 [Alphaproteobacteria bacterium]|nr:hypothetical protein [Alphaproteobacteria bacterium]
MLNAQDTQFSLAEDGHIHFQQKVGNPLPGEAVAVLSRGDEVLTPKVTVLQNDVTGGQDEAALQEHLEGWLKRHTATVLEPLVGLQEIGAMKQPAKDIAVQVHEALGIIPREQIEDLIAQLDADDRRDLRTKKIRLGPILVFIPALNKPAAVRLRALLWGLYNDKELPMQCPKDGIVSFEVEGDVDTGFYQAIAYPVFGKRAIRIDMLDRVISAVYDAADKGKFQAEHKMAEWLGSSIEGLYDVLEAMGHKKIFDPADEAEEAEEGKEAKDAKAEESSEEKPEESSEEKPEEKSAEEAEAKPAEEADAKTDEKPADKPQEKPDLAVFRLKKGKAFEKEKAGGFKGKKGKPKGGKKDERKGGKRNKSTNRSPKIMSVGPEKKPEDSPFAILEQLKKQSNEKK